MIHSLLNSQPLWLTNRMSSFPLLFLHCQQRVTTLSLTIHQLLLCLKFFLMKIAPLRISRLDFNRSWGSFPAFLKDFSRRMLRWGCCIESGQEISHVCWAQSQSIQAKHWSIISISNFYYMNLTVEFSSKSNSLPRRSKPTATLSKNRNRASKMPRMLDCLLSSKLLGNSE